MAIFYSLELEKMSKSGFAQYFHCFYLLICALRRMQVCLMWLWDLQDLPTRLCKYLQMSNNTEGSREKGWDANTVVGGINSSHAFLGFLVLLHSFFYSTHVQRTGRVLCARVIVEERKTLFTAWFRSY